MSSMYTADLVDESRALIRHLSALALAGDDRAESLIGRAEDRMLRRRSLASVVRQRATYHPRAAWFAR